MRLRDRTQTFKRFYLRGYMAIYMNILNGYLFEL
jgi:hypothetical protein